MRLLSIFVFGIALAAFSASAAERGSTIEKSMAVANRERTFRLHLPPAAQQTNPRPMPLVLVLHGGGGNAEQMERFTHFSDLADREGFIVAYPDGIEHSWNDGRDNARIQAQAQHVDDVGFIRALIQTLAYQYPIDSTRVYATGISNGAILSHRLAAELSESIAAIAPVDGGLAEALTGNFSPEKPVSVLAIQGTEDPLVPYDGGEVKLLGMARGRVIGTREVLKLWIDRDRCNAHPSVSTLPDRDPQDGCRAELSIYGGGDEGSEVRLIRVEGGGHTWPGGRQYAGKWLIGTVCRDFDATQEIWNFFKTHRRATRAESE